MTGADFTHEERLKNLKNTMERLLALGALPIINENDTIATDEIKVGDNDTLSALVASSLQADLLVILSDIDGLYTADPHKDKNAVRIERVRELTPEIMALGGGEGSSRGTGGMRTKLHAAEICMAAGVNTVIASGEDPAILYKLVAGEGVGTLFGGK